ncbi:cytochrome P450 [Nocardia terpenica]|uniref:Cytochrome P450 n=1 Tax=Nocardia terpenica TaxID=455432 RepID=A0A6G9Z475_9NOCA|nr:cytochrome P450 [Nocardia terpenica]QIS20389.1 cytochrome P450 [Nocardia terpenica]
MELWGLFDPAIRADPYSHYRALRARGRSLHDVAGAHLFLGYSDCAAMFRSPAFGHGRSAPTEPARSFLFLNPPEHTRLRRLVSAAFTPQTVESLRSRIERIVDGLLDVAAAANEPDLVRDFARPLPVTVICELLGIPLEDRPKVPGWSRDLAVAFDPDLDPHQPPEILARRDRAHRSFAEYLLALRDRRMREPADDLISRLVAGDDGDSLGPDEFVATCELLLLAGHETTVNLIGNATVELARNPDLYAALQGDPGLAGPVVEETLRMHPSVQFVPRIVLAPTVIDGLEIAANDLAIAVVAAANRDPDVFSDPDTFRLDRPGAHHLSFGVGPHFCLGAPLARLEGTIAVTKLASRGRVEMVGSPTYAENNVLRGPATLPVRIGR